MFLGKLKYRISICTIARGIHQHQTPDEKGTSDHPHPMKTKLIILALSGFFFSSAFAADSPVLKPAESLKIQTGGLYAHSIGGKFLAVMPEKPSDSDAKTFITKHITGISWEVTDSRNLGEDLRYGLTLKSPAGSDRSIPSIVHVSGLPTSVELKASAHFQLSEDGGLTLVIGKKHHLIIQKADLVTANLKTGTSGLAAASKPAGQ